MNREHLPGTATTVDQLKPGDVVHGTWSDRYPAPKRVVSRWLSPGDSRTATAYGLLFDDDTEKVYYGHVEVYVGAGQ